VDVRRLTGAVGVAAALAAALLVGAPRTVLAAGVAGAVAAVSVDRGVSGLAGASLALAAAAALLGSGVAAADSFGTALAWLFVAGGVAGCLSAPVDGGRVDSLLGAWTGLVLLPVAVLAALTASAGPFGSLLGSRLALSGGDASFLAVPAAVAAGAGWVALSAWREAGLPPWTLATGPAVALLGLATLALPVAPEVAALAAGDLAAAPLAYALLWSTATVLVASALAGTAAAEDRRFRRGPAWAAVALGPLALGAFVAADGGVFVAAALVAVPPLAEGFGAAVETADAGIAAAFLAAVTAAGVAFIATLPARAPLVRRVTAGRPAGVGAGCLLAAVALTGQGLPSTVAAGGLAVLAWALLAPGAAVPAPPRTTLSRGGLTAAAVAGGCLLAVVLVGTVPKTDPGVGGVLLLGGVAVLGLAIR